VPAARVVRGHDQRPGHGGQGQGHGRLGHRPVADRQVECPAQQDQRNAGQGQRRAHVGAERGHRSARPAPGRATEQDDACDGQQDGQQQTHDPAALVADLIEVERRLDQVPHGQDADHGGGRELEVPARDDHRPQGAAAVQPGDTRHRLDGGLPSADGEATPAE
jgi:hypothetical protein